MGEELAGSRETAGWRALPIPDSPFPIPDSQPLKLIRFFIQNLILCNLRQ
ncbi:hypothetical protein LC55x_0567 [Lysobacter capsici]|nr:hypothetical protein LC55x_0567 [Lysobacter capsici]